MPNPDVKQTEELAFGGFWIRLLAYMIDLFVIGLVIWLAGFTIEGLGQLSARSIWRRDLIFTYSLADFCQVLACCAYFTIMTFMTGATIGKTLLHLKVISQNGEKLKLLQVIYRETIGRYISAFLFLGYIIAGTDSRKRGFHDMLSDTYVVQTDRMPVKKKASAKRQKTAKTPSAGAGRTMPARTAAPGQPFGPMPYPRQQNPVPYSVPQGPSQYQAPQGPAQYPLQQQSAPPYSMQQAAMPYASWQQAPLFPQMYGMQPQRPAGFEQTAPAYGMPAQYQGTYSSGQMYPGGVYTQPGGYQPGQNMYGGMNGPAGAGQAQPPEAGQPAAAPARQEQKETEGKDYGSQGL